MTPPTPSTMSPGMGLQPGDKLDKYEVRDTIGAGGMAIVHKGYDALMDRFVAIKQINLDLAAENGDEGAVERFRREARLQKRAAPQHKHLVSFIDFIEEPRGLFIIQEYVDGVSLEQVLTTKPQPMDHRQALGIIGAVTMALQAVHSKGIIHRDLKPSNILLPHDGGLKVCDFGLAATISEQETLPLGSVRYMAPELFRGDTVDGRADIYALGMIAYEMLLGRAVFNETFKIVLRDQRNQALRWMKWHTNVRVRATPLNQINPNISDTLSDLVARMMDKDPQTRIQSADELLETIRRHFTPGASPDKRIVDDTRDVARAAPQVSTTAATAKLPSGSKLPYVLVALLIINVLAGLGLWAWYAQDRAAKREAIRVQAREVMAQGQQLYREGKFAAALPLFEQVHQRWANDPEFGDISQTGILLSQARLAYARGEYIKCIELLDAADQLGKIGDRQSWSELKRMAYEEDAFTKVVAQIESLIDKGQFPQARFELNKQYNFKHPPHRLAKLEDLQAKILQTAGSTHVQELIEAVNANLEAGRPEKALEKAAEGAAKYPGSEIDRLYIKLKGEAELDARIAAATAAELRGDNASALAEYTRALQLLGDSPRAEGIRQRIKTIQLQLAVDRMRQAFAANDATTALSEIETVLALDPGNEEAVGIRKQIATADEFNDKVRAGDNALVSRDFPTAIKLYSDALVLRTDPAVASKLLNARLQLHLENARIQMAQKRFDEASATLSEAQSLAPDDPTVQNVRTQLEAWIEFQKLVDEGDAARAAGRYDEATDRYRKSNKLAQERGLPQAALDEVRQRIDGTEYESLLAKAQFEMDAKRWSAAYSWLQTLKNMPNGDTPKVREMIDEVKRNMPNTPASP